MQQQQEDYFLIGEVANTVIDNGHKSGIKRHGAAILSNCAWQCQW
jgi:hypothetical protein